MTSAFISNKWRLLVLDSNSVVDSIARGIVSIIILATVAVSDISICMCETEIVVYLIVEKKTIARRFEIMEANTRQYRPYNAVGRQVAVRLIPLSDNSNLIAHFLASVNDLFEHAISDVDDSDMVGITIQNQVNQNNKPMGISFRQKDQLTGAVIWSVFERVSQ